MLILKKIPRVQDHGLAVNSGLLILRVTVGFLMLTHGFPKLVRLLSGNLNFSDPIGLGPEASLVLTVFSEAVCSVLILLGLWTRLAAVPLIITMAVILFIVHGDRPVTEHINVILYSLGYLTLLIAGSGKYSIDYLIQKKNRRE